MPQNPSVDPGAFFLTGGPIGVLLIHGFTGTAAEMRIIGNYLHKKGYTVSGPLLPGHGTTVDDMNRRRWTEWTAHVEQALLDLQARCTQVFVGGLSMGAALTAYLAIHHPEITGIVLYSPAMWPANRMLVLTPVLKYLVPKRPKKGASDLTDPQAESRLWHYEYEPVAAAHELLKLVCYVRSRLPQIVQPALVIHSTRDTVIHPTSARRTYAGLGSKDKELVTLHNSGHCLTVDSEWEFVAEKTYTFIQRHSGGPSASAS